LRVSRVSDIFPRKYRFRQFSVLGIKMLQVRHSTKIWYVTPGLTQPVKLRILWGSTF